MSTVYLRQGSNVYPTSRKNLETTDALEPATYQVAWDNNKATFYLEEVNTPTNISRVYGDVDARVARILHTYDKRLKSTGVLLAGRKGTGKSFLAKELATAALASGIPVIMVAEAFSGAPFNTFIDSIEQKTLILFDEFDKTYSHDRESQEALLTLLDGTAVSRKLFVFTCNDVKSIDSHMLNRPGRIFYRFDYGTLDIAIVKEYCNDNLNNKAFVDDVVALAEMSNKFSFDGMAALVEEVNRYNETPKQALRILNIDLLPEQGRYDIVKLTGYDKKKYTSGDIEGRKGFRVNPALPFMLYVYDNGQDESVSIRFLPSDLTEQTKNILEYKNKQGNTLVMRLAVTETDDMIEPVITFDSGC